MDGISNLADQLSRSSVNPASSTPLHLNSNHHNGTSTQTFEDSHSSTRGKGGQRGIVDMSELILSFLLMILTAVYGN